MDKIDKIVVIGNGWLGNKIGNYFDATVLGREADPMGKEMEIMLDTIQPNIVINCAGKTGRPNIDWCQDHKLETLESNVLAVYKMNKYCKEKNIYFVHIGSGCIYEGYPEGGFREDDEPNFDKSFYSLSKILAERMVNGLICRIRMPVDAISNPRNLINKLLNYENIINTPNSMTIIPDFLVSLEGLIKSRKTGIYNMCNSGTISPSDVMLWYSQIVEKFKFNIVEKAETKAPRSNCELNVQKLARTGYGMPDIKARIIDILYAYKLNK